MNFLYPKLRWRSVRWLLRSAFTGALVAGCYGVVHDQITFGICPEYFTRLKFIQFHWADVGLPDRIFVAQIGFLASWWVGFIGGWFIGRVAPEQKPAAHAWRQTLRGLGMMLCFTIIGSFGGYFFGLLHEPEYGQWSYFAAGGVSDLPAFVRVAYIHNGSYLGGFIGLVAVLVYLKKGLKSLPAPAQAT